MSKENEAIVASSPTAETENAKTWVYDKFQDEDFCNLVKKDGLKDEDIKKILELRDIKDRNIFEMYRNSFSETGNFFENVQTTINDLTQKLVRATETKDSNRVSQLTEEILYLRTMQGFEKYGLHICLRVNAIFKRRKAKITELVIPSLEAQLSDYYKDGGSDEMGFDVLMRTARNNLETVDLCLPFLESTKEYNKIFEIIRDNPQLAKVLVGLSCEQRLSLSNYDLQKLVKYYHPYRRLDFNNPNFHLPDSNNYCSDENTKLQYRIPWELSIESLSQQLQKSRDLVTRLESALEGRNGDRCWEVEILDGEGKIFIDKTHDYILVRVQGTDAFQFEPYYLRFYKSGMVESSPGLGGGQFFDRGVMVRENFAWKREDTIEDGSGKLLGYKYTIIAVFSEQILIDAIIRKINGDTDVDIAKESGFEDYVLAKPL